MSRLCSMVRVVAWPVGGAIVAALVAMALAGTAAAQRAYPATDVLETVSPRSDTPGNKLIDRFPLSHYTLDYHVEPPEVGLGGVDTGLDQVPGIVAQTVANHVWAFTRTVSALVIKLFTWAFSLDLLRPDSESGPLGAIGRVITDDIYGADGSGILGREWMAVAVLAAGLWALWNGLVRRRFAETTGALALSALLMLLALAIVLHPRAMVGEPIKWTNQLSTSFLGLADGVGSSPELYGLGEGGRDRPPSDQAQAQDAKTRVADTLFQRLVFDPWTVLEFGGLRHCVDGKQLVAPAEARRGGAFCLDHKYETRSSDGRRGGYAGYMLAWPPDSKGRKRETQALQEGKTPKDAGGGGLGGAVGGLVGDAFKNLVLGPLGGGPIPGGGRETARRIVQAVGGGEGEEALKAQFSGRAFDQRDTPAADLMRADQNAGQRLGMALLVLIGSIGVWLFLGSASLAVILAQVYLLVLLGFSVVMLLVAMWPRGQGAFIAWLGKLGVQVAKKAIYALVLAITLAVSGALERTVGHDWLLGFGLQALFFWSVFLYRHDLANLLVLATTSGRLDNDFSQRLQGAYYSSRMARGPLQRMRRKVAGGPDTSASAASAPGPARAAATTGGAAATPGPLQAMGPIGAAVGVAAASLGHHGYTKLKSRAGWWERQRTPERVPMPDAPETPQAANGPARAPNRRTASNGRPSLPALVSPERLPGAGDEAPAQDSRGAKASDRAPLPPIDRGQARAPRAGADPVAGAPRVRPGDDGADHPARPDASQTPGPHAPPSANASPFARALEEDRSRLRARRPQRDQRPPPEGRPA